MNSIRSILRLKMMEEPWFRPPSLELKKEPREIRDSGVAKHGAPS